MKRRKFIQWLTTSLLARFIDKPLSPVVKCNQDEPRITKALVYPIRAHTGQIRTTCDYSIGDNVRVTMDGATQSYKIVSVAIDIIGEIGLGLASPGAWLPVVRG